MKTCVAKFTVQSKEQIDWSADKKATNISMGCVYDSDPESENGKFFVATPSGSVNLGVVNDAAAEVFEEVGDEILCTFRNLSAEKRTAEAASSKQN